MVGIVDNIKVLGTSVGSNTIAEVEPTSLARRSVLRSNDVIGPSIADPWGGSYSSAISFRLNCGNTTQTYFTSGAIITIAALQWIGDLRMVVKKITGSIVPATAVTAGGTGLSVFKATSFRRQYDTAMFTTNIKGDEVYTQNLGIGSGNKKRSIMLTSENAGVAPNSNPALFGITLDGTTNTIGAANPSSMPGSSLISFSDNYVSTTASNGLWPNGLAGGDVVVDTVALGGFIHSTIATPPKSQLPMQSLFDSGDIGHPIVLENFTGLIFKALLSDYTATVAFRISINLDWDELPNY